MNKMACRVLKTKTLTMKFNPLPRTLMAIAISGLLFLNLPGLKLVASANGWNAANFSDSSESFPADLQVDFDWKMPERFGKDAVKPSEELNNSEKPPDGWVDPVWYKDRWHSLSPGNAFINPDSWEVELYALTQIDLPIKSYKWEVWGYTEPVFGEQVKVSFKSQGAYPVKLTVTAEDGRTATIAKNVVVKDLLIVSLGDSIASGEGNPDADAYISRNSQNQFVYHSAVWANKQCHRSMHSGPAQSALDMEKADPHTSVTFISLACSGAETRHLIDTEYKGAVKGPVLDPQITALRKRLCPDGDECAKEQQRPMDALLISIGANDVGFAGLVKMFATNIWDTDLWTCTNGTALMDFRISLLELRDQTYQKLKTAIDDAFGSAPVYITEYLDPTHHANEQDFCLMQQFVDEYSGDTGFADYTSWVESKIFRITPDESQCAYQSIVTPLNNAIRLKAEELGWNFVGGIMDAFKPHGYCTTERWVVRNLESYERQGNELGTMHPNKKGHRAYAGRILDETRNLSTATTLEGNVTGIDCNQITGWAWDKSLPFDTTEDGSRFDHPLYVTLYDDDQPIATVLANESSPADLVDSGAIEGKHGFVIPIPANLKDGNRHSLSVKLPGVRLHLGSIEYQLTCAPLSFEGSLDPAGCENVTGFAWDRNNPAAILSVDIFDGEDFLGSATANQTRTSPVQTNSINSKGSAASVIPPGGSSSHGFVFRVPDQLKDGKPHSILVRFKDADTVLNNSPRSLSCVASSYQGLLDPVSCGTISGYAWNKDQPGVFLNVDIYDGATRLDSVRADQVRQSPLPLNASFNSRASAAAPPVNNHGFTYVVPDRLKDGKPHVISVKFTGAATTTGPSPSTSVHLSRSPQTLTCIPSSYEGALTSVGCDGIFGYARDKNRLQDILKVDIFDGNKLLATVFANQPPRSNDPLGDPLGGGGSGARGNHNFSFSLPDSLKDGKAHSISAKYAGTPAALSGSPKQLTVPAIAITQQPVGVAVCVGKAATFSVTAVGSGLSYLSYQWRKNGVSIPGETKSTLTIGSVVAADAANYSVTVGNSCSLPVTSNAAQLSVSNNSPMTITRQPQSAGACVGQPVTFSVAANGANLRYQWRKNGGNIYGETASSLTIRSLKLSDAGTYSAVVYNGCDSVVSGNAVLTINNPIEITSNPVSVTKCAGQSVTFSATATGTNLRYLWRKNGGNIAGAESSSYTIPSVTASHAGAYSVVVYNGCSTIESARATLTVNTTTSLALSSSTQAFAASGGNGAVAISGCGAWTVVSNDSWITLTGAKSGSGNGSVSYSVAAYQGSTPRAGTITIGGKTLNVTQRPAVQPNNSQFVIQSPPPVTMTPGQRHTVTIKMKNTGANAWTAAGACRLVSQGPAGNTVWGLSEISLPSSVAPNVEVTFIFTITAPATPGVYRFEWRMMQGTSGFGSYSPALDITVSR